QIDVRVSEDDVGRRARVLEVGEHGQCDHADAGAAVMGQQRVVLELPERGDRVNQQARIVVQRVHVWRGGLVGQAVAGKIEQVDVEIGVKLAGQRHEINARGGEAVHADQC